MHINTSSYICSYHLRIVVALALTNRITQEAYEHIFWRMFEGVQSRHSAFKAGVSLRSIVPLYPSHQFGVTMGPNVMGAPKFYEPVGVVKLPSKVLWTHGMCCSAAEPLTKCALHLRTVAQCGCAVSVVCYQKVVANRRNNIATYLSIYTRLQSCKSGWSLWSLKCQYFRP